jgi:hypothetical protein
LSSCSRNTKTTSYMTFVWQQLEYSSSLWDPHTQSNIQKNWRCPTHGCTLHNRQIPTHQQRDRDAWRASMGELANPKATRQANYDVPYLPLFQPSTNLPYNTSGPILEGTSRYRVPYCRTLAYSHRQFGCETHCHITSLQRTPWRPSERGSRNTYPCSPKPFSF